MGGSGEGTPISIVDTFVVEDGSGKSDANSYLSVAGADTYHANYTMSSDWEDATATAKENALIVATQYLDLRWRNRWRGNKGSSDQALAWPRAGGIDDDGFSIDSDTLPQKLKDACAELALRVVLGDGLLGVQTEPGEVAQESITVGPISESKTYSGARPASGSAYPLVDAMVAGIVNVGGQVFRG